MKRGSGTIEYRLLGPVQVWVGGSQLELKRRQERLLLAILLLEPGKAVAAERLIELLWPEELPGNPRRALQVYVSRLRSVLTSADPETKLESGPEGYALRGPAGRTDVERFTVLARQAKTIDGPSSVARCSSKPWGSGAGPLWPTSPRRTYAVGCLQASMKPTGPRRSCGWRPNWSWAAIRRYCPSSRSSAQPSRCESR